MRTSCQLQAKKLLSTGGKLEFEEAYGRDYIYGQANGGWFYAVFSFAAHSQAEKQDIQASLQASFSGMFTDANLQAKFRDTAEVNAGSGIWPGK